MEYLILQAFGSTSLRAAESLELDVENMIDDGYKPCGGISVTLTMDGYLLAQAMVKA